jgi:hypothetical protein
MFSLFLNPGVNVIKLSLFPAPVTLPKISWSVFFRRTIVRLVQYLRVRLEPEARSRELLH